MERFYFVFTIAALIAVVASASFASFIGRLGFPLPPDDRRLGCIDGLRGYLALSVLAYHFFIWVQLTRLSGSWALPSANFVTQMGAGGVALFFMTTGFVFYPRVLRGFAAASWPAVYITRVFRIIPLVAFSVAAITLIIMLRTGAKPNRLYPADAAKWISTWGEPPLLGYRDSALINAKVLWSLWYEWLFYLFVLPASAAAMDLVSNKQRPTWIVPMALLGIAIVGRILTKMKGYSFDFLRYLPLFAIGMLAFELQENKKVKKALATGTVAKIAGAALLLGMIATDSPYTISMPLFGFFFICVACGNDFGGLLKTRGSLVLGECSFGIYLLHGVLLNVLFVDASTINLRLDLLVLVMLLPIVAVAAVLVTPATYLLIERPAMRTGKSLLNRLQGNRLNFDSRELEVAP